MQKLNEKPDNPFRVPENYFEEVNMKIISGTAGNEKSVRKLTLSGRFRATLLIAASISGFILIGYTAVKLLIPDKKITQVSEVLQEISPDSYINDIDISSLEEDASSLVLSEEGPDVNKSDIVDYLLNENIDINEIYEHL